MGRGIADTLEEPLIAVLIGSGLEEAQGRDLIAQGADTVLLVDDPGPPVYMPEPYTKALVHAIEAC